MHKHIELLLYVVIGFLVVGTASILYFDTNTITTTSVEIPITGAVTGLEAITGATIGACRADSIFSSACGCADAYTCEAGGSYCGGAGNACDSGYKCVEDEDGYGSCVPDKPFYPNCQTGDDCNRGENCVLNKCVAAPTGLGCIANGDCATNEVCNTKKSTCAPSPTCTTNTQCTGNIIICSEDYCYKDTQNYFCNTLTSQCQRIDLPLVSTVGVYGSDCSTNPNVCTQGTCDPVKKVCAKSTGGLLGPYCETDAECLTPLSCKKALYSKTCQTTKCLANTDCTSKFGTDYACFISSGSDRGKCQAKVPLGSVCTANDQCTEGGCNPTTNTCSLTPGAVCTNGATCDNGQKCIDGANGKGLCPTTVGQWCGQSGLTCKPNPPPTGMGFRFPSITSTAATCGTDNVCGGNGATCSEFSSSKQCASPRTCNFGKCGTITAFTVTPPTGTANYGNPCNPTSTDAATICKSGLSCDQTSLTCKKSEGTFCRFNPECLTNICDQDLRVCATTVSSQCNPACASGQYCQFGVCIAIAQCLNNANCPTGKICNANGECVTDASLLKKAGAACTDTSQCKPGLTCSEQGGNKICLGTSPGIPCSGTSLCATSTGTSYYCGGETCGGINAQCATDAQCQTGSCTAGRCRLTITGLVGEGGPCDPTKPNDRTKTCVTGLFCSNNKCVTSTQQDPDSDGLTNGEETANNTNPNDPDSDDDGLKDGEEVKTYHTDPNDADSDNDGWKDGAEVLAGSNPNDPNSKPQECQANSDCSNSNTHYCAAEFGVCVRYPAAGQNGWPSNTCRGQGGITCSEGEICNGNLDNNLDVFNCCKPRISGLTAPSCTATDFIASLGTAVQINRGQCLDDDNNGEGTRVVSIKDNKGDAFDLVENNLKAEDLITECASVSCTCDDTRAQCNVACTTLPAGGETRTTVPYYTLGGALITLSLLFGAYFFRKKRKL